MPPLVKYRPGTGRSIDTEVDNLPLLAVLRAWKTSRSLAAADAARR